jgi:hypothetical protein
LRALWGLWGFSILGGQHRAALTLAQRFYALASKRSDPNDCLIGERMIGTSQYYLGELPSARRRLERVVADYRPPVQKSYEFRLHDQRVAADATLARVLWLHGFPDQAMRTAKNCVEGARAANHAPAFCLTLAYAACSIALWVGDLAAAERYVEMLLYHSTRHGLARWRTFGRCYLGIISIRQGNGSGLLRVAFSEPTAAGPAPWLWTLLISAVSDHADQIADGLPAIEEAIVHFEHAEERWVIAELLRVKGELLLWRGPAWSGRNRGGTFPASA